MVQRTNAVSDLNWLLEDLVQRVADIRHAVLLSADGLLIAASAGLERADAEHLSAVASGFSSLARGAGRHFENGSVRQTVVELDTGFLFVTAAGYGANLAVVAAPACDVGLVAFEMNLLIQRVGKNLATASRTPLRQPRPDADPLFQQQGTA
ncbi:Predicted regulator of Ras-like GTPase activity, Roadblock/LC7/MglB family [Micromonospora pattaloongensis]|uniref:Predicted regulator of Ras-like GTPase activity, Roadblock/LC7/MglB family n=1 Tax=Micromonospora pattaloongensis TaxID=405436 RepID=A0A1H3JCG8_9ACTN|nr:Predicted regulator of Ras-like GTPase activity, Roadblock/LC7/MglB family [Micromonospora pattaloongensis]